MLTVKVHTYDNEDGLSIRREVVLPAIKTATDHFEYKGKVIRYLIVTTPNNENHSFDIKKGRVIYIENLNKETVQVYKIK